jgi:hypothetical protein
MMTKDDLRDALDKLDQRRLYLATLSQQVTRNVVTTEKIHTGLGESYITLNIPWSYCIDMITKNIADIERWLTEHEVSYT